MRPRNLFQSLFVFVSLLIGPNVFGANVFWTDVSPLNHLWSNAENWNTFIVPNPAGGDNVYNEIAWDGTEAGHYMQIDTGITANCYDFTMGYSTANVNTRVLMTGGSLNVGHNMTIGKQSTGNIFDMESGEINITSALNITTWSAGSEGTLNLKGGAIYAASLGIKHPDAANGQIDITGGELYLLGDVKSTVEGYVTIDNLISGNGVYSLSDGGSAGILVELTTVESMQYTKVSYVVPEPLTMSVLLFGTTLITLKKRKSETE